MRTIRSTYALPVLSIFMGCGGVGSEQRVGNERAPATATYDDVTADAIGASITVSPNPIDLSAANPFFANFGTNGRVCETCHQEAFGWTITPALAKNLPATDPLFVFDGSDCLPPGVSNPNPGANSTQMLSRALVRIEIGVPATADYTLVGFTDPLGCPTPPSSSTLRMYRRPLPAANTAFQSTIMWDGRENVNAPNNTTSLVQADLEHQSNDATLGHAQAAAPLPVATQQAIMAFETGLFNAQRKVGTLALTAAGANGGGEFLYENTLPSFFIGINDQHDCSIVNSCQPGATATFSNVVFTIFSAWETKPPNAQAASIGRGEALFNTRSFNAAGTTCSTCHDSPNVGNHSTSLPFNIGIASPTPVGGLDVSQLPTYTFQQTSTGALVTVTDPGVGLISGSFKDLGKTKVPVLRGLAARAPYFHNGAAPDLNAVVTFYNAHFNIGLTAQEQADLVAFLQAL